MSAVALAFVVADWWLGYWTCIAPQRARHGLVLFDRHLLDVLVDPRRYRYGGPDWLARLACRSVPRPDVVVVLDASPAVVRARKQEVTPAESERQRLAYRHLAADTRQARLVDASGPSEQVVDAVLAILDAEVRARSPRARRLEPPAAERPHRTGGPADPPDVPAGSSHIPDR
jgi:thymidylate kinase